MLRQTTMSRGGSRRGGAQVQGAQRRDDLVREQLGAVHDLLVRGRADAEQADDLAEAAQVRVQLAQSLRHGGGALRVAGREGLPTPAAYA